ncbi:DUF1622 domain-containing protein [Rhizobium leguminosarum]|uniref:DUF1622 domain-containing protein n=1 Tax=Rhizobium leguminosarum TaxID=384 RepID=UPI00102F6F7A|nr:DUF1622 domain-containing protein [Rhizobium leguminosarum]TAU72752.1 DUF1622 domain-containing protein [Rhizobium leguminosarum]TAV84728.1 DUF1622 domain-containing protein [Rhizobium leguminosarum]TAV86002.1 DUF1622 domain-containing protein [Rhizobium leguminosarum]TAW27764.1 DUF1622 domain-containing protein [Rhizobium leguminosarum]TAX05633.1 DUF1622 domain-containing protein [Rhizobium leguminosarum]
MKEWLVFATEPAVVIINAMALLMIAYGTSEAFLRGLRAMVIPSPTGDELRHGYLRYARWLIAGLTFQLAADVIETAIAPSWDEVGRLAAIAVIRTFLNYFLERDLKEADEAVHGQLKETKPASVA